MNIINGVLINHSLSPPLPPPHPQLKAAAATQEVLYSKKASYSYNKAKKQPLSFQFNPVNIFSFS